jgi:hypothetical protein
MKDGWNLIIARRKIEFPDFFWEAIAWVNSDTIADISVLE